MEGQRAIDGARFVVPSWPAWKTLMGCSGVGFGSVVGFMVCGERLWPRELSCSSHGNVRAAALVW
jgi:hypothetical protein